jgi:hypothetical protein
MPVLYKATIAFALFIPDIYTGIMSNGIVIKYEIDSWQIIFQSDVSE